MTDLLLNALELGQQREHYVDVHASRWRRPIFDQRGLIVIQQVRVIIVGYGCRDINLLLHPPLLLCRDHRLDSVEVLVNLLLDHFFPHLLRPHLLDPPPLAGREDWRTPTRCWSCPGRGSPHRLLLAWGCRNWMVRFRKLDCPILRLP
jgi:hypothetical protein